MQQHEKQMWKGNKNSCKIQRYQKIISKIRNLSSWYNTLFHKNSDILTAVTTASYGILLLVAKRRTETLSCDEKFIRPSLGTVTVRRVDKTAEGNCILSISPSRSAVRCCSEEPATGVTNQRNICASTLSLDQSVNVCDTAQFWISVNVVDDLCY